MFSVSALRRPSTSDLSPPPRPSLPSTVRSLVLASFFSREKKKCRPPLCSSHRSRAPLLHFRRRLLGRFTFISPAPAATSGSPAMGGSGGSGSPLPLPHLLPYPWEKFFLGWINSAAFDGGTRRGRRRRSKGNGGGARLRPLGATCGRWLMLRWTRPRGTAPTASLSASTPPAAAAAIATAPSVRRLLLL